MSDYIITLINFKNVRVAFKLKKKNNNFSILKIEKKKCQIFLHFLTLSWQSNTKTKIKYTNLELKN